MNPLLRYVNQGNGPISHVFSSIQPGLIKPFYWYSIAKLSDNYRSTFGARFHIPLLAYGWDQDKLKSQEKAIHAALILWAQKIHSNRHDLLGYNINSTDEGFAIAHSLSESEVQKIAEQNAIHAWAKRQMHEKHTWTFRLGSLPLLSRCRFLLPQRKGRLFLLYTCINTSNDKYYFAVSIYQFKSGECILGSACEPTVTQALDAAVIENYARYRFIQRVQSGREQLLDKMSLQRQWLYASDAALGKKAVASLLDRVSLQSHWYLNDPQLFSKTIPGPWNNDLILHRMLYTRSLTNADNFNELPL